MQTTMKQGLSVKDLVTVGIFPALFLVFALVYVAVYLVTARKYYQIVRL